jgi:hypothetical protein
MNVCISYMPCPAKALAPAKALPSQPPVAGKQAANQPSERDRTTDERPMKFPYVINVQMTKG